MRSANVSLPVVALIAATRGLLGAGIGLLIAGRLDPDRRARLGRILLGIGAASTIPLAATVIRSRRKLPVRFRGGE